MLIHRSVACSFVLAACLVAGARPATAQSRHSVSASKEDSLTFIVARKWPGDAITAIRTRDRNVALLLTDTTVVMELTDRGMAELFRNDTTSRGIAGAIFANMMKAGIASLFDHGIAYRLTGLRRVYAEGGHLILEDSDGKRIFEGTEYNGHHPMEEFSPGDAERFAASVREVMGRR